MPVTSRLLACVLAAALCCAPAFAAEGAANDDDGPYLSYVGDGLEARWVCDGTVQVQRITKARWPVTLEPRCGYPRALQVRARAAVQAPARINGVPRLAALSDVHGRYDLLVRLLQANGIIDAQGHWSWGSGHLVLTGDVFDRGDQVNEVLWLLYTLEQEAREAGGALDFTLGNHESLVLRDDLRYIHDKYRRNSQRLGTAYPALYGPDTVLGDWLRSKRTVVQVDELLFVHGGLGPAFVALGLDLDQANERSRASLGLSREQLRADPMLAAMQDGADSPIWYRGYFFDAEMTRERVEAILERYGAQRIVVGHTSQPNVQSRFDGRVIAIDSSIKDGESGELFFREDGVLSRGLLDGRRVPVEPGETPPEEMREETINALLRGAPIIDGHQDFARHFERATPAWSLDAQDFAATMPGQVDVPRLRAGRVGASLVSLGSDAGPGHGTGRDEPLARAMASLEWLDALVARYPQHLARATDVASLEQAQVVGRISLVPTLGHGSVLEISQEDLRALHARGLRAMTVVTPMSPALVREMNRLGLLIDLSYADDSAARETIALSRAPVFFSHSNARAIADTPRNVPDDLLDAVAAKGGLVMLTPTPGLVHVAADRQAADPPPAVTVAQFADHVDYVARRIGEDHVGIGSDFDGMGEHAIEGLGDVSQLPALFVELKRRGWTDAQLRKLSRGNFLRVWGEVERVAREADADQAGARRPTKIRRRSA